MVVVPPFISEMKILKKKMFQSVLINEIKKFKKLSYIIQPERVDYDRDDLPVKLLSIPFSLVLLRCRVQAEE